MRNYGNKQFWEIAYSERGTGVIMMKGKYHYCILLPDWTRVIVPIDKIERIEREERKGNREVA